MSLDFILRHTQGLTSEQHDIDTLRLLLHNNPSFEKARMFYTASSFLMEKRQDAQGSHALINNMLSSLSHYGFWDLDPGSPRWYEQETLLGDIIEGFNLMKESPELRLDRIRDRAEYCRISLPRLMENRRGFIASRRMEICANIAKPLAGWDQQLIEFLTQAMALVRLVFMHIGSELNLQGVLDKPEDIFFLSLEDLRAPGMDLRNKARERLREHSLEVRRRMVPQLLFSNGEAIFPEATDLPFNQLRGTSLTRGSYSGRVRIIDRESIYNVERGDIYVIRDFDYSWVPKLVYAGAIIVESSDSSYLPAIMGRVMAVPAVMGIAHASQILKNGMKVHVNGTSGVVTVEEAGKPPVAELPEPDDPAAFLESLASVVTSQEEIVTAAPPEAAEPDSRNL